MLVSEVRNMKYMLDYYKKRDNMEFIQETNDIY